MCDVKPLDEETRRFLDLAPHLLEGITDMWEVCGLNQGWEIVGANIENRYGARLATLSRLVYSTHKRSNCSTEALRELIKQHTPRQTATEKTPGTYPAANQTAILPTREQNQVQISIDSNDAPVRAPGGVEGENIAPGRGQQPALNTLISEIEPDVFMKTHTVLDRRVLQSFQQWFRSYRCSASFAMG